VAQAGAQLRSADDLLDALQVQEHTHIYIYIYIYIYISAIYGISAPRNEHRRRSCAADVLLDALQVRDPLGSSVCAAALWNLAPGQRLSASRLRAADDMLNAACGGFTEISVLQVDV